MPQTTLAVYTSAVSCYHYNTSWIGDARVYEWQGRQANGFAGKQVAIFSKTPKTNVTSLSYYKASQRLKEYCEKNPPPPRPDFSTWKTDPDFGPK